jgi:8-oxo-dGTP diphosphatase
MDRDVSVAAGIIIDNDRILACQRGHGELAGGWEFPGGKLEPGETAAEACVRELREELGVEVADLQPFASLEYEYPSFHMHLETFTCRIDQGTPTSQEHWDMRWLGANELDSVQWLPADVQVVNVLRTYMQTGGGFRAGYTAN